MVYLFFSIISRNNSFWKFYRKRMAKHTPLLDVQHLTKSIGDLLLFDDISFSIADTGRVGLIARNGAGKSTLLNILTGHEDYDTGDIVYRNNIRVGYLEQSPAFDPEQSVIDVCFSRAGNLSDLIRRYEVCMETPGTPGMDDLLAEMDLHKAWDFELRAKQILTKLDISEYDKPMRLLSGGQKKRVALANVLLSEPDLLIMDEPTNHLDLGMTEWLENYLQQHVKALLMVTHDRYFLNRVCSDILELDDKRMFAYHGSYEYYLEKREERMTATNASIARAKNLYRKELDWMRRMPCARGHKARYRQEAFYELEKQAQRRMEERTARLEVKGGYIGSKIFEAEYVSKSFGEDKVILKDFYYNFSRYEKMGIVGNNGTGKSTFLKLLLGEVRPDSGRFVVGETVRFGYYAQEGLEFDKEMKVIDAVRRTAETIDLGGGRKLTAGQLLTHFLFPPARQQDYIYKLSGGERRRLYLCTVLMTNPNFLILDEPTNDLDIATLQILEEYLADFRGCVIIVSHDRYFMDKVVDHLLVFKGNGVVEDFPGNYTQYREWEEARQAGEKKEKPAMAAAGDSSRAERSASRPRKLTFKEKRELETLEKEIEALEAEKKDLEEALCSGRLPVEELTEKSIRLPRLQRELDEKSERWLELSMIGEG